MASNCSEFNFLIIFLICCCISTGNLFHVRSTASSHLTVPTGKLFVLDLHSLEFNWPENSSNIEYKIIYNKYPDLPDLFNFISNDNGEAYLYSIPFKQNGTNQYPFEIISINWDMANLRRKNIVINIGDHSQNVNDKMYEIYLKIDNSDITDILQINRMKSLKNVIANLWMINDYDLFVTYFESAITLGSRMPLDPNDREGVVMKLSSKYPFSKSLIDLENEIRPLWKFSFCPRNFKRTSVEILFRNNDLVLDWCKFRLIKNRQTVSEFTSIKNTSKQFKRYQLLSIEELPTKSYLSLFVDVFLYSIVFFCSFVYWLYYVMFKNYKQCSKNIADDIFKKLYLAKEFQNKMELTEKDRQDIYATLKSHSDALYSVSRTNTLTKRCAY